MVFIRFVQFALGGLVPLVPVKVSVAGNAIAFYRFSNRPEPAIWKMLGSSSPLI